MQSGLGLKLIETSQLCNLYKKKKKNKQTYVTIQWRSHNLS